MFIHVSEELHLHLLNGITFMAIVDTHSIEAHTLQLMYREPKFTHFWQSFLKELIIIEDQINASKILHSTAIYIQSMNITRSM